MTATSVTGQVAADAVTWPAADLARRVRRALDIALAVVDDFGRDGYDDAVRPALGFRPEKVIAEAAMLAYVAATSADDPGVRGRAELLAGRLAPLARSREALADLALRPERVFKRCVPHVLLTALGHPDRAFDAFAAERCARVLAHAVDEPATVHAERAWIARVWDVQLPAPAAPAADTALHQPFDLQQAGRENPYGLTHLLFYTTDFGRWPDAAFPRPRADLFADVEALVARFLDHDDFDLVAELLMGWPQLRAPWTPGAVFAFRVLASAEDEYGVLPCRNLDPERLTTLDAAGRTRYARAASYHTAFVMGLLCAVALRPGAAPPLVIAGPQYPGGDPLPVPVGEGPEYWRGVSTSLADAERAALAPFLADLAVARALRLGDYGAAHRVVVHAEAAGLPTSPARSQAATLLSAIDTAASLGAA